MGRPKGEGSTCRRSKDGRLGAYVTLPATGGKRVYAWCPRHDNTPRRQEQVRRQLLADLAGGRLRPEARQPLADYLAWWLGNHPEWSAHTRAGYGASIALHIGPALGGRRLGELTALDVEIWLSGLAARLPGAAAKAHAVLRAALADALRLGLVAANVAAAARSQSPPSPERPVLGAAEVRRLLAAAEHERLGALVTCAVCLAMRRGELLGVRWADVDLDGATIRIVAQRRYEPGAGMVERPPKAGSRRELVLPPIVVEALRRHRARQAEERKRAGRDWREHGLVFANTRGRPHWTDYTADLLARCLARAGLPHVRLHDLRHGAISLLLELGAALPAVMQLAGHRSIATTARYVHALPGAGETPARLMDAAFNAPNGEPNGEPAGEGPPESPLAAS